METKVYSVRIPSEQLVLLHAWAAEDERTLGYYFRTALREWIGRELVRRDDA